MYVQELGHCGNFRLLHLSNETRNPIFLKHLLFFFLPRYKFIDGYSAPLKRGRP